LDDAASRFNGCPAALRQRAETTGCHLHMSQA
jgi:hypothetical protein